MPLSTQSFQAETVIRDSQYMCLLYSPHANTTLLLMHILLDERTLPRWRRCRTRTEVILTR